METADDSEKVADAVILLMKKGKRLPTESYKNCTNCANRDWDTGREQDRCLIYGASVTATRQHAHKENAKCDLDFSGWKSKLHSWWQFWKR